MRELNTKTTRQTAPSDVATAEDAKQEGRDKEVMKKTSSSMIRSYLGAGSANESAAAEQGTREGASEFPHRQRIEQSFGMKLPATAHTGDTASAACQDLGAEAYTTGSSVVFGDKSPSLHTAAHEAAHVIQQKAGSTSASSEAEADEVADRVVAGKSASTMLPAVNATSVATPAVQKKDLPEHKSRWASKNPTTPPDMVTPRNWHGPGYGPPPTNPHEVQLDPGTKPPFPPNTTRPGPGSYGHPLHHKPEDDWQRKMQEKWDEGKVRWTPALDMRRQEDWDAYRKVALYYQNNWNAGVPFIKAFNQAESDPSLQGQQLRLPSDKWSGNLEDLANAQDAGQGNKKVSDVFDANSSSVKMSQSDKHAADRAATRHGRNKTTNPFHDVASGESGVAGAFHAMIGAKEGLKKAHTLLSASIQAVEAQAAANRAAKAQNELDELKKTIESNKKVLGWLVSLPIKLINLEELSKEVVGEALTSVYELGLDKSLEQQADELESKVKEAQSEQRDHTTKQLALQHNAAVTAVKQAVSVFKSARSNLQGKYAARNKAYNQAGTAVYHAAGGGRSGRQLEAIITAIPRVETVVGHLAQLTHSIGNTSTDPQYNAKAGTGLAMAWYDQNPAAYELLTYVDWLFKVRVQYGEKYRFWLKKLESLHAVKTKLAGTMAGGTVGDEAG